MPAAPTSLTVTQVQTGSPAITIAFSHDGIDLDRFEVLRRTGTDPWESVALLPASSFGAGPYSFTTASPEGYEWAVRALNAAGAVSV